MTNGRIERREFSSRGVAPTTDRRRNLVVVRAGDDSTHAGWLAPRSERGFEVMVSYYGGRADYRPENVEHFERRPGMKWPGLADLFGERCDWMLSYDACWFPDDDISSDGDNLRRMFELFHTYDLWLAQPALVRGSYASHTVTRRVAGAKLRLTNFVEIMCPIFSRDCLIKLAPTFRKSFSGWGLDYLWPHLLGYPADRLAVLDATPVLHGRPIGRGPNYERCKQSGVSPRAEWSRILGEHSILRSPRRTLRTIPCDEARA